MVDYRVEEIYLTYKDGTIDTFTDLINENISVVYALDNLIEKVSLIHYNAEDTVTSSDQDTFLKTLHKKIAKNIDYIILLKAHTNFGIDISINMEHTSGIHYEFGNTTRTVPRDSVMEMIYISGDLVKEA